MSTQLAELQQTIRQLSVSDRAALAHYILQNLDDDEEQEEGVEESWQEVIKQRVDDHLAGKAAYITEEELFARLNKGST